MSNIYYYLKGGPPLVFLSHTGSDDEGLTFTHGYTTPICRPSLASIITGAVPHQTLVTGNDLTGRPPDQIVEERMQVLHPLPRTLATELGYTSFQTGKWWEGDFANGGFTDVGLIFDGFYIDDFDDKGIERPELTLDATIQASAALSGVVFEAGVSGGLTGEIEFDLGNFDAPDAGVTGEMGNFGGIEQGLGRHAAAQNAESAQFARSFDDGHVQSLADGSFGSGVATTSSSDHDEIKFLAHGKILAPVSPVASEGKRKGRRRSSPAPF